TSERDGRSCRCVKNGLVFLPFAHGVSRQAQARAPEVARQPGFVLQRVDELSRFRKGCPDLRQECRPASLPFQNDTVDARRQSAQEVALVGEVYRYWGRQQRYLDARASKLFDVERRK